MLTNRQKAIVNQTVPVLQTHGETLTRHFYARMFRVNPEIQAYFNPAHQRSGSQQRALAGAILAYAQHIDNPAALSEAVELIAQKHASLRIKPEHYPIVGDNLLASIREVLGEAATDEVIDAWAAAYGQLADIFIAREQRIYQSQKCVHGWSGFKSFVVTRREPESDNITSFYLEPQDGTALVPHRPGQYVAIRVTLPSGETAIRNYSLSNAPNTSYLRISIKREVSPDQDGPDGVFSTHMHDRLAVDARVDLSPPCGEFTLELPADETKPVVFIAGGIGATPLISMLHAALERSAASRPILFIQGALNGAVHAFTRELRELKHAYPNLSTHVRYSAPNATDRQQSAHDSEGLIDAPLLDTMADSTPALYYCCGPTPMLQHVHRLLRGRAVPNDDIRYEFFGPADTLMR